MRLFILNLFMFISLFGSAQELDVLLDTYEDNASDWPIFSNESKRFALKEGRYVFESFKSKTRSIVFREYLVDRHQDFLVETSLLSANGKNSKYFGLVLGYFNWDNYAAFQINKKGRCNIYQVRNGKRIYFAEDMKVSVENGFNLLQLKKEGGLYKFYVNHTLVLQLNDFNFIGTGFGYLLTDKQSLEVDFIQIQANNLLKKVDPIINGELEQLSGAINSKYTEKSPIISASGQTLYFTVNGDPNLNINQFYSDAAFSKLDAYGNWTERALLPGAVNNGSHNFLIGIAPDENHAYFGNVYCSDGSMSKGLSESYKVDGLWQTPVPLDIKGFKNDFPQVNYAVDNSGRVLIMAIEEDASVGGTDLYVSFKQSDGSWSKPLNMGNVVNTFANELTPFIASDGKSLYFSSYGHKGFGSADVFVAERLDDSWVNWSVPKNLGSPINGEDWDAYFKVDAKGEYGYMVSAGNNSLGHEDIFRVQLSEEVQPEEVVLISGKVVNAETGESMDAKVFYEDLHANIVLGEAYANNQTGYSITLPSGRYYGFQAEMEGFISSVETIGLQSNSNYKELSVTLYLTPIKDSQEVILNTIDIVGDSINKLANYELDLLAERLADNPMLVVDLQQLNLVSSLSPNQTQQIIINYLVGKGVNPNQIISFNTNEIIKESINIVLKLAP